MAISYTDWIRRTNPGATMGPEEAKKKLDWGTYRNDPDSEGYADRQAWTAGGGTIQPGVEGGSEFVKPGQTWSYPNLTPPINSGGPGGPQPAAPVNPGAIGGLPPPAATGTDSSGPLEGLKGAGPAQPIAPPITKPPEPDSQDEPQSTWLTGKKPAQPGAPLQGLLSAMPQPDMPQAKQLPKQLGGLAY